MRRLYYVFLLSVAGFFITLLLYVTVLRKETSITEIIEVTPGNISAIAGGHAFLQVIGAIDGEKPRVYFGKGLALDVQTANDTKTGNYIRCVAPVHAPGIVDVTIVNPNGSRVVKANAVTYTLPQQGKIHRVNASSSANRPDGKTWETAFPNIQEAIDATNPQDEIWVAAGTYVSNGCEQEIKHGSTGLENENRNQVGLGQPSSVVAIGTPICLYGGFSGSETERSQRDSSKNETIIDGLRARRCINVLERVTDAAIVDGFTIQYGKASEGGGMYAGTAVNCIFKNNKAHMGGGIYIGNAINSTFTKNEANSGGGIFGGIASNCTFIGNSATIGGGMTRGTATNSIFSANSVRVGTGVFNNAGGIFEGTVINCTITRSTGGGIGRSVATNCILWENSPFDADEESVTTFSCLSKPMLGNGNISATPAFINSAANDYRIRPNSPCIDKGTAVVSPENDFGGHMRPEGAGPDIGAYEYFSGDNQSTPDVPVVLFVNIQSKAENPDGLTWERAFPTLQQAADRLAPGSEIWVAKGAYTVNSGKEVLALMPNSKLFGGFSGTETTREERDWQTNATIIDGQDKYRCISANPEDLVDGFTLQHGKSEQGGGMCQGSAVNCTFVGNTADYGGAIYSGKATHCFFTRNIALEGGGAITDSDAANCSFFGNRAGDGGASHRGTVTNCIFSGNFAYNGGGADESIAMNCTFAGNSAHNGGGINSGRAKNCIIWGNSPNDFSSNSGSDPVIMSFSCFGKPTKGNHIPAATWGRNTSKADFAVERRNAMGNISVNPLFVNPWANDFRLQSNSLCIDAGRSKDSPSDDFSGHPRPQGEMVDMGAFEFNNQDDCVVVETPPVLRVNAASTANAPDGKTWENAFPTLQQAADQGGYGAEIWVATGVYKANAPIEVLLLKPNTKIYGGFAGMESNRDQRNWNVNKTVIDGEGVRRCVTANQEDVVDGFTLQNGKASSESLTFGGGLYQGTAVHCIFLNNQAFNGGGMYSGKLASNCIFVKNSATNGGAINGPSAINCTFFNNVSAVRGSAMRSGSAINCIFFGNGNDYKGMDSVSYSCLSHPEKGDGNIVAVPQFIDPENDDFRLQPGSPCIDAGSLSVAPGVDVLGAPRPQGSGYDMGACEFPAR